MAELDVSSLVLVGSVSLFVWDAFKLPCALVVCPGSRRSFLLSILKVQREIVRNLLQTFGLWRRYSELHVHLRLPELPSSFSSQHYQFLCVLLPGETLIQCSIGGG